MTSEPAFDRIAVVVHPARDRERAGSAGAVRGRPRHRAGAARDQPRPVMAAGTHAFVCTPLAMHGGTAPSLVIPAGAKLIVDVSPGYAGFDVEIDGHRAPEGGNRFGVALQDAKATLVSFGAPGGGAAASRRRRLIADSPRILAPDDRAAHLAAEAEPPR